MAHTYYNFKEIPIPDFAKVNKATGVVYVLLNTRNKRGDFNRRNIGKRAKEGTMYVNDNFRRFYPDLWDEHYGGRMKAKNDYLHCGLYAAMLGILKKTKLYDVLQDSLGPQTSNALMDFSMYSILYKSDAAISLPSLMEDQALFSNEPYSDSWYSDLFHSLDGNDRKNFLDKWLEKCREDGLEEVWLCVDGSNNECSSGSATLATPGHSKTKTNNDIVSYMYAVDSRTGMPVTYDVYYGSIVDKTAFTGVTKRLMDSGIKIKGVILDRGFCTEGVIDAVEKMECSYIIMAPSSTKAGTYMITTYADKIRWKVEHIIDGRGIFGIKDKTQLFSNSRKEGWAYLFFDAANGSERSLRLIANVMDAEKEALSAIEEGKQPTFPHGTKKYFNIKKNRSGRITGIERNNEAWQLDLDSKGYSVTISSDDLTPEKVDELYDMRDVSEKTYSMIKSQLGFSVTRTSGDNAILNKMLLLFIATIIRREFINTCKLIGSPTNTVIGELNKIHMILGTSSRYYVPHKESGKASKFLAQYEIDTSVLEAVVDEYNERENKGNSSLERTLPPSFVRKGRGRPKKETVEVDEKKPKKKGRPKGSKNKKTLLREQKEREKTQPPVKRKVGRPRKEGT